MTLREAVTASAIAASVLIAPTGALSQQPSGSETATSQSSRFSTDIITFTVPLIYQTDVLGDVLVEASSSSGNVRVERQTLLDQMGRLLNDEGFTIVDEALGQAELVSPDLLEPIGISLAFDKSQLALVLGAIPGEYRPTQLLGGSLGGFGRPDLPVIEPEPRSAYLNVNLNLDYNDRDSFETPEFFLNGAARFNQIVLEYDGAFSDQFGEGYRFYRRGVRAVYDQPEKLRRFSAGDLRIAGLPILRTPFIGGVSIEKGRRNFETYFPAARLGSREIFLDNQSTVEVLINGDVYQNLNLAPGRYDLADIPVQLGSNDIQLIINDSAGRRQIIDYDFFYQPLDLENGEEEYTLAVGAVAENLTFEPRYTDELAAVGQYRRAFNRNLILGGGFQLSDDLQVGALSTSFVPQVIPGGFDIEGAYSSGPAGSGYTIQGAYRFNSGNTYTNRQQFSINATFESEGYQTLSDIVPLTTDILSIGANYTRSLSERTFIKAGAIYTSVESQQTDRSTYFFDVVHRFNENLRLTGGLEYGRGAITGEEFGVRVGLTYALGPDMRVNADYRSRQETFRATLSKASQDTVGSVSYDLGVTDTQGQTSFDGSAFYTGNRFEARVIAQTNGDTAGDIFDRQTARLQFGTSLAWAGKNFGIGRPINDSFALLKRDPAIGDVEVVSGLNLSGNDYDAKSGALGAAVQGDLVSYAQQSFEYDVDSQIGIDIGDGIVQVDPPYRAGYSVKVGSSYFISAAGFLKRGAEPVSLTSGIVRAIGDDDFSPETFFTNSAGRFAILGLAPGGEYEVTLNSGEVFTLRVPEDETNLYRMGDIDLETDAE